MPHVRANGIDIEYESFGRESDPLILLIMGFGAQLIFWPETLCEGTGRETVSRRQVRQPRRRQVDPSRRPTSSGP